MGEKSHQNTEEDFECEWKRQRRREREREGRSLISHYFPHRKRARGGTTRVRDRGERCREREREGGLCNLFSVLEKNTRLLSLFLSLFSLFAMWPSRDPIPLSFTTLSLSLSLSSAHQTLCLTEEKEEEEEEEWEEESRKKIKKPKERERGCSPFRLSAA